MSDKENEVPTIKLDSVEAKKGNNTPYSTAEQKALHDILHKTYPIIDSNNIKPLAIGFLEELIEKTGLSKERLKTFLKWYCGSKYQTVLKAGEPRYNLSGQPVENVTTEDEIFAQIKLDNRDIYFIIDKLFFLLVGKKDAKRLESFLQAGFRPSKKIDLTTLAKNLTSKNEDVLNILSAYEL